MRFPHRDLVIVVTYVVVILTLVVPGLTLAPLIERLGLGQGEALRRAEAEARARITSAALERLNELVAEGETPEQVVERLRERYEAILERVETELDEDRDRDDADVLELATRVQEELLKAERETLAALERDREYPAEVLRRLQAELDLEESRLRARAAA
jgi:CPA1 family monovalent cation:H+ antiporter